MMRWHEAIVPRNIFYAVQEEKIYTLKEEKEQFLHEEAGKENHCKNLHSPNTFATNKRTLLSFFVGHFCIRLANTFVKPKSLS